MEALTSLPKIELHLHLEGAIPLEALWQLVLANGAEDEVDSLESLRRRFTYRDFPHFLDTWMWKLRFHRTYDDYEFLARAVATDLRRQGHVYVEAFLSPTDASPHGLEVGPLLMAVRRGLDSVEGIEVALVPDLVRNTGPERTLSTLAQLLEVREEAGVLGITLGGAEHTFPAEWFTETYERARNAGLRLTAHAGEGAGSESVRTAVEQLGIERIGHGVRAVEDPELLELLVERQIPFEVCPTSNIRTGVAPGWNDHQLWRLLDVGAMVTINTDDPTMFGCDLHDEMASIMEHGGYDLDLVERLTRNAVEASWTSDTRKSSLHASIDSWSEAHLRR